MSTLQADEAAGWSRLPPAANECARRPVSMKQLDSWASGDNPCLVYGYGSYESSMPSDLFRANIAEVPFVDAVTTMSDPSLPLTVTKLSSLPSQSR
jgi:protease II